jgi:hypothetical protein
MYGIVANLMEPELAVLPPSSAGPHRCHPAVGPGTRSRADGVAAVIVWLECHSMGNMMMM